MCVNPCCAKFAMTESKPGMTFVDGRRRDDARPDAAGGTSTDRRSEQSTPRGGRRRRRPGGERAQPPATGAVAAGGDEANAAHGRAAEANAAVVLQAAARRLSARRRRTSAEFEVLTSDSDADDGDYTDDEMDECLGLRSGAIAPAGSSDVGAAAATHSPPTGQPRGGALRAVSFAPPQVYVIPLNENAEERRDALQGARETACPPRRRLPRRAQHSARRRTSSAGS